MEQKRMFLAIGLIFLIILGWQSMSGQLGWESMFGQKEIESPKTSDAPNITQPAPSTAPPALAASAAMAQAVSGPESRHILIDTPLYQVEISEQGALVRSFKLKAYRETNEKNSPPKELIKAENSGGMLLAQLVGNTVPGLSQAVYTAGVKEERLSLSQAPQVLPFSWKSENGVTVQKIFTFYPDSYRIDMEIRIRNGSDAPLRDSLSLSMMDTLSEKTSAVSFEGPSGMVDDRVLEIKAKKLSETNRYTGQVSWAAFQDRYFMTSILMPEPSPGVVDFRPIGSKQVETRVTLPEMILSPGQELVYGFRSYFGPKSITILKSIGNHLEKVVDFGWFDILARPCLWLMNLMYRFIPNYGVAIILLTVLVRIILWPLANKSYKSMKQMRKLQPLIADLRERCKGDKQKMNLEMMALYKAYKVNPMGGCLPMLVQFPILIALYRMLYQAVELRHAPFYLVDPGSVRTGPAV